MCLCVDLGYPWRTANRPPGTFGNAPLLVVRKDKVYSLVGRAEAHSVFVIHDGSKDYFTSAPPCVRVLFESTAEIREFTRFDVSSKVFAIILEQFKTKGPLNYEMSAMKLRNVFGKGTIKLVSPRGTTAKQIEKLFRGKATAQATSSTNIHETPASTTPTLTPIPPLTTPHETETAPAPTQRTPISDTEPTPIEHEHQQPGPQHSDNPEQSQVDRPDDSHQDDNDDTMIHEQQQHTEQPTNVNDTEEDTRASAEHEQQQHDSELQSNTNISLLTADCTLQAHQLDQPMEATWLNQANILS